MKVTQLSDTAFRKALAGDYGHEARLLASTVEGQSQRIEDLYEETLTLRYLKKHRWVGPLVRWILERKYGEDYKNAKAR